MNRDEWLGVGKQGAEFVGRNFFDDWVENVCWVFLGLGVGALIGKFLW